MSGRSCLPGGVMPLEDVDEVAALARENDAWVLSDEIYSRLIYKDDGDGEEKQKEKEKEEEETGGGKPEIPSVFALPGMEERTAGRCKSSLFDP